MKIEELTCFICKGKVEGFTVGVWGLLKCSGLDPRGKGCGVSLQRAEGLDYAIALWLGEVKITAKQ